MTDDVIWYLGNGALTKKWSDGFSKSIANKIANYPRCQIIVVSSLSNSKKKLKEIIFFFFLWMLENVFYKNVLYKKDMDSRVESIVI